MASGNSTPLSENTCDIDRYENGFKAEPKRLRDTEKGQKNDEKDRGGQVLRVLGPDQRRVGHHIHGIRSRGHQKAETELFCVPVHPVL